MRRARVVLAAIVALSSGVATAYAADLMHFSVTQVRQLEVGTPAVRAYLDLADSEGRRPEELPEESLTATLGEFPASLINLTPAWTINQGVAYTFLVDISRSLSPELFRQMVAGIETWVEKLGPSDRAAIIAFGETSSEIVDFTADHDRLLSALADLGPTDDLTLLHQALIDALDLSRRLDPDLPGRRVIVIFSDGKDEGSSYEAEDVMAKLRADPAPIYAIGYSRLRDPVEKRMYLALLQRFAFNSGGTFFAAEQTRFAAAYEAIHETIGDVWITDFVCTDCRLDGSLMRLQVKVDLAGQVLSSGGSVRLLPLATASAAVVETDADLAPGPTIDDSEPELPTTEPPMPDDGQYPGQVFPNRTLRWLAGAVGVVIAVVIYTRIKGSRNRIGAAGATGSAAQEPSGPIDPRSEPDVLDPPMPVPYPKKRPGRTTGRKKSPPAPDVEPMHPRRPRRSFAPKQVRLIVVRGSRKGRQYNLIVDRLATVGKRSDNDCVLADEPGIDAAQFELYHEEGALFVRNLSDLHPTLVNGQPVAGRIRLASDTLIGTGETVLRIVFQ